MNKHDELIERWKSGKISLCETESAFDLLQLYGDTLELISAESQMKIPTGNGWTYTYSEMAAKALAGDTVEGE